MEVHRVLGPGFLEAIYKKALWHELRLRGLDVTTELEVPVTYKNEIVGKHRLDIVVEGQVILELKAMNAISEFHTAQTLSYMTATRIELALILNFECPSLSWKRLIKSRG